MTFCNSGSLMAIGSDGWRHRLWQRRLPSVHFPSRYPGCQGKCRLQPLKNQPLIRPPLIRRVSCRRYVGNTLYNAAFNG